MGAGHAHRLYRHGHSPVHGLPPHTKLAATFAFVVVVVSTPREAMWAFGLYAVLLALVAYAARVPAGFLLKRLLIEVPFVAFAVLMPFVAEGERVEVLGMSLSVSGLWGAWNVLAKGTLGVAASVLLASTTELRELLLGLQRLRLPPLLVQVGSSKVLEDDAVRVVDGVLAAGGDATLQVGYEMVHVFQMFADRLPEAQRAVDRAGGFVHAHARATAAV